MKNTRLYALLFAAVLTAACTGCSGGKKQPSANSRKTTIVYATEEAVTTTEAEEINIIAGEIGKEITENNTSFVLNSVIDPQDHEGGEKFIYLDITLKNNTDREYNLSTINNFYIELSDGSEVYSNVRTQLYAKNKFSEDKYFVDPFDIPSNGQFSGIIGGFILDEKENDFKLCFYPTGDDPSAKTTVIKYDITAADIKAPDTSELK